MTDPDGSTHSGAGHTKQPGSGILLGSAIALGIGLRLWEFLYNAPLWLDELALVNGILAGPFAGLLGPSDFAQVAPSGFLLVEWLVQRLMPGSEMALRVFPLLASIMAVVVTAVLAIEILGKRDAWIATGLVALSGPLVAMGSQVKPYAGDALAGGIMALLVLRHLRLRSRNSTAQLLLAGILMPWFALGSVFTVAAAGLVVGRELVLQGRDQRSTGLVILASWGLSGGAALLLANHLLVPASANLMEAFWTETFLPFPPASISDVLWPIREVEAMLWSTLGLRLVAFFALVTGVGALTLWFRNRTALALLTLPFVFALVASALHRFPFGGRVSHWMVVGLAMFIAAACTAAIDRLRGRARYWSPALGAMVLASPAGGMIATPPPWATDQIRPAMTRLQEASRPGDVLWAYWGASHTLKHYGDQIPASLSVVIGACAEDYPRSYFRQLDAFRGTRRLWVILNRVNHPRTRRLILNYLGAMGTRLDSLIVGDPELASPQSVGLYLFDLSEAQRPGLLTAETFPVPLQDLPDRTPCELSTVMFRRVDGSPVLPPGPLRRR